MAPVLSVNDRSVNLTNLTKPIWPDQGYTKQDLIRYYIEVSPFLLPHLQGRPLVVQRFPEGIRGEAFYQKNIPEGSPDWIDTCPVTHEEGKITRYIIVGNLETLIWLGNQACLELHPWLSSSRTLEQPDFAVFDLDPMEKSTFEQVCRVALVIRDLLAGLDLRCYPKTSGATGIQLYLPLTPTYSYREVRRFVEAICWQVHELRPDITTMERIVEKRQGKIYLDYLQNVRGKTIVAPYSPRPLHGAPVSMPLSWEEVAGGK
ncbi:MAG TPA: DNA polymerase domain-containing protein, partial [Firmicutes bacterium]|nr:DNA polymerase domain-containing protein [Bacillota bacterium]